MRICVSFENNTILQINNIVLKVVLFWKIDGFAHCVCESKAATHQWQAHKAISLYLLKGAHL